MEDWAKEEGYVQRDIEEIIKEIKEKAKIYYENGKWEIYDVLYEILYKKIE